MKTAEDLARIVSSRLKKYHAQAISSKKLTELFQIMFLASIKPEEGKRATFQIIYLDPKNPDPRPPSKICRDRWSYVPFKQKLLFSVENLSKIAHATDPRSSSLVIYPDSLGKLRIWGFVDQMLDFYSFIQHDSPSGPERPGFFQASVAECGHITVYKDYERIADLCISKIVTRSSKVLREGIVSRKMERGIRINVTGIGKNPDLRNLSKYEREWIATEWKNTFARILFRMKQFGHGGTLLLTSNLRNRHINLKYKLSYDRLRVALNAYSENLIKKARISEHLHDIRELELEKEKALEAKYLWDLSFIEDDLKDSENELEGCIWFIALLSRIDGAIVMNKKFEVIGFGAEIVIDDRPDKIYSSQSTSGEKSALKKIAYNKYGTRHRSVMRYCAKDKTAVGFIASQDRRLRVVSNVRGKILLWDNVQLGLDDFSGRSDRPSSLRLGSLDTKN